MGLALKFGLALSACVCLALADPIPVTGPAATPGNPCDAKNSGVECAQMQLFRTVKSFFDQDKIELVGGLSLVKTEKKGRSLAAAAETAEDVNNVENAKDSEHRETALEDFTMHKVTRFLQERTLHWNLSPIVTEVSETARSVADHIPSQIKSKISEFFQEGKTYCSNNTRT